MSDLHIEICEAIEKILEERLCLEPCEMTYEIALEIFNMVLEKTPHPDYM